MAHPRKALVPVLLALFCLSPLVLHAQSSGSASDMKDGIDLFRAGQFDKAILLFHNVILDPSADALKPQAYLLIAKSYMATGALDEAERNIEFYIATYPNQPDYPEALYQKGRLLFMQADLENAIQSLQAFIGQYPRSPFVSSAWFWAGESLYGLGRLDDALAVYQKVVTDFPSSAKVEAAQYKVSLIQLRKKEVELTKLLKWSHEDFLRSVEEYQNRERAYEQAIQSYQKRLTSTAPEDAQQTIAGLQKDLAAKTAEANQLSAQLARAGSVVGSGASAQPASDQVARLQRLLAAQAKALDLKEAYLSWLEANMGAGK
jgi:TolA-binding protein